MDESEESNDADDDDPSDSEIERPEVMEETADLLSIEAQIRELFDDVTEEYVRGNPREGRKMLRKFARNNRNMWDVLTYIFGSNEGFKSDAKKYFDERTYNRILSLQDEFSKLTEEINVVEIEVSEDKKNPLTTYTTDTIQTTKSEEALIHYKAKSGDVNLVDTQVTFPHLMHFSRSVLSGLNNEFSRTDVDDFSDENIEDLHEGVEEIREELTEIEDFLPDIDQETDNKESDPK